jgi:hypothetical protein
VAWNVSKRASKHGGRAVTSRDQSLRRAVPVRTRRSCQSASCCNPTTTTTGPHHCRSWPETRTPTPRGLPQQPRTPTMCPAAPVAARSPRFGFSLGDSRHPPRQRRRRRCRRHAQTRPRRHSRSLVHHGSACRVPAQPRSTNAAVAVLVHPTPPLQGNIGRRRRRRGCNAKAAADTPVAAHHASRHHRHQSRRQPLRRSEPAGADPRT